MKRSILKVYKVYFFISKLKKRFDGRSNHHHHLMMANSLIKNIVKRSILKVYKVYFFISKLKKRFDGSSLFLVYFSTIFFFQAEDGIRDRSPSRGLGDVYKRQGV